MRTIWPVVLLVLLGGSAPLTNETIRVQRLELVDSEGKVRGFFSLDSNGAPDLALLDAEGEPRIRAKFNNKGMPGVMVGGKTGAGVLVSQISDGSASVSILDAKLRTLAGLVASTAANSSALILESLDPKQHISLTNEPASGGIVIQNGSNSVSIGASPQGTVVSQIGETAKVIAVTDETTASVGCQLGKLRPQAVGFGNGKPLPR